tara:strand:+ start:1262 stop:1846 length:585 start_codon:yes stop_codon:yes gene_type:complete
MTKEFQFYFDFISPYSYLAYKKLNSQPSANQINITYKPILLGGLHKLGGIIAPAFNERKMRNMKNDCELVAIKNNINFKWNTKFPINSLNLMRGYLILDKNLKQNYFDICFNFYWRDNIDISDEKNIYKIIEQVGLNKNEFYEGIKEQKIKDKLKILTKDAFNKDIFGAPTFVVNQKIFWGQDRLEYALDEYYS